MDMLPVISVENLELFLSKTDNEEISWTVFLSLFSNGIWIALITMALIIAFLLTIVDKIFHLEPHKFFFINYLANLWVALKANIGGKHNFSQLQKENASNREHHYSPLT